MTSKITVVGREVTTAAIALLLAQRDCADLVLLDAGGAAPAPARDAAEAAVLLGGEPRVTGAEDWAEAAGSSLVVICADRETVARSSGEISRRCPDAVVIVVSDPVEEMCMLVREATLFTRSHVLGVRGIARSARLRAALAREAEASVHDVAAMVLESPGGQAVPVLTNAMICGSAVRDVVDPDRVAAITGEAGAPVGVAAVAAAVRVAVDAIVADTRRLLVCTALCEGEYGIEGRFAGVPVRLGRGGIEEIVEIPLDDRERALLATPAQR